MIQQFETDIYPIYNVDLVKLWMEEQPLRISEYQTVRTAFSGYMKVACVLGHICDNNYCAAILLGNFYEDAYLDEDARQQYPEEYTDYDNACLQRNMLPHLYPMEELFYLTSHLFTREELLKALSLLKAKGYINIRLETDSNLDHFTCQIYRSHISNALNTLLGSIPTSPLQSPVESQSITTEQPQEERNNRKEAKKVAFHIGRAKALGLPATLTLEQWISTLNHFNWKCAYCVIGAYDVFEHFTPLFHGGGTTHSNCVPACNGCNSKKRDAHPSTIEGQMQESTKRVLRYLQSHEG